MLRKSKTGKVNSKVIDRAIIGLVILLVLFKVYEALIPEAQTAGDSFTNASNTTSSLPLASLFAGDGVVFVVIMAALIIIIVRSFLNQNNKK